MTYQELLHQLNIYNSNMNTPYKKNWYLTNRQIQDMKDSYQHNHPVYMKVYPSYVTVSSTTPAHMSKYIFIYGKNEGEEFSAVVSNQQAVMSSHIPGSDNYEPMGDIKLSKYVSWTPVTPESLKGPLVNFASTPIKDRKLPIASVQTKVRTKIVHDKPKNLWTKIKDYFK